jgi:hypothetical protein
MHCALPPSEPPGWGAPALLSSCCCWRSATSRRLAAFSHCSASRIFIRQPGRIPSPMVTQEGDHRFNGGEKQAGLRPLPRPQLQGSSSSLLARGVSWGPPSRGLASRFFLRHLGVETILQLCGAGVLQPCGGGGGGELLLLGQGAAFRPLSGRLWPAAPEGLTTRRTLRGRYSCSETVPFSFSWREWG